MKLIFHNKVYYGNKMTWEEQTMLNKNGTYYVGRSISCKKYTNPQVPFFKFDHMNDRPERIFYRILREGNDSISRKTLCVVYKFKYVTEENPDILKKQYGEETPIFVLDSLIENKKISKDIEKEFGSSSVFIVFGASIVEHPANGSFKRTHMSTALKMARGRLNTCPNWMFCDSTSAKNTRNSIRKYISSVKIQGKRFDNASNWDVSLNPDISPLYLLQG
jgi:hypothetical protein